MTDSVFDIALEKRFTDSTEITSIDVTSGDALLIRNAETGVVMRLSFSTLTTAISAAFSAAFSASFASLVDGKVPASQLPSFVDDVLEYASIGAFPATGETGNIYVSLATNLTYRWSGSAYIEISASPGSTDAVPEGATNKYYTDARARAAVGASGSLSYNPTTGIFSFTDAVTSVAGKTGTVILTKSDVGLGNVDNTSDANKPVSTAQQTAINDKLNNSGSNTHNGQLKVQGLTNASGVLAIQPGPTGGGRQYNLESIGGSIFRLYDASAGAERWRVDANGHFLPGADNTYELGGVNRWKKIYAMKLRLDSNTAVAPTGGSAAALPALPVGYFEVDILGTNYKVPYYG